MSLVANSLTSGSGCLYLAEKFCEIGNKTSILVLLRIMLKEYQGTES